MPNPEILLSSLWTACWKTFLVLAFVAGAVWLLRVLSDRSDDKAASVNLSREAPPLRLERGEGRGEVSPVPDLIACACQTCKHVRTVDQRWLPPGVVPLPAGCRISHGLCPACERLALLELGKLPPRPMVLRQSAPTLSPLVPVSAG